MMPENIQRCPHCNEPFGAPIVDFLAAHYKQMEAERDSALSDLASAKEENERLNIANEQFFRAMGTFKAQLRQAITALEEIAQQTCEASDWHDIEEDGVSRCIDPEYMEMGDLDPNWFERPDRGASLLTLCNPCLARRALSSISGGGQ